MADISKLDELFRRMFAQADKEKANLKKKLDDLDEQRSKIEEQAADVRKELDKADEKIAAALERAAKEHNIPVEVITGKGRGRPPKGAGSGSAKATDAEVKKVLRAIPKGKGNALTSGEVAKATEFSTSTVSPVLKQLVADKKIKAAGERRARRYWKTP